MERKTSPVQDAIAKEGMGIEHDEPIGKGTMIELNVIEKEIEVSFPSNAPTPEEIKAAYLWNDKDRPKMTRPTQPAAVASMIRRYRKSVKDRVQTPACTAPSDEQKAAARAQYFQLPKAS